MKLKLPPSYHLADQTSLSGQNASVRNIRIQLSLLLVAGIASAVSWKTGRLDVAALIAGAAFVGAASFRFNSLSTSPHQRWYEGRAAAESIKTLAWRYATGASPFPIATEETAAAELFAGQVREVASDLKSVQLRPGGGDITDSMRELRHMDLSDRRSIYLGARIVDQEHWYSGKAQWNAQRAQLWSRITLGAESVGAVGAFLAGFGVIHIDVFGLAGALAAVTAAWLETKQHDSLASAYGVAAAELRSIATLLQEGMAEDEWARRASDSEEAISREHTLWRARVSRT